jgi:hypothetical protein
MVVSDILRVPGGCGARIAPSGAPGNGKSHVACGPATTRELVSTEPTVAGKLFKDLKTPPFFLVRSSTGCLTKRAAETRCRAGPHFLDARQLSSLYVVSYITDNSLFFLQSQSAECALELDRFQEAKSISGERGQLLETISSIGTIQRSRVTLRGNRALFGSQLSIGE